MYLSTYRIVCCTIAMKLRIVCCLVLLTYFNKAISFHFVHYGNYLNRMNDYSFVSRAASSPPPDSAADEVDDPNLVEDSVNAPIGPMPTVSSKVNFPKETLNIKYDLWLCGAGTIGEEIVKEWKKLMPDAIIAAETKSTNRHEKLTRLGAVPRARHDRSEEDVKTAKHVIIAIPPSAAAKGGYDYKSGYLDELSEAARLWAGPAGGGSLIFTSSIGVYGDSIGNIVTENFRTDSRSAKSTNLLAAEETVLTRGGAVARLAGLYLSKRGPHTYWMTQEAIDAPADGLINLVHYEDAARAVVLGCMYNQGKRTCYDDSNGDKNFQSIFLVSDDNPISRLDICKAALDSGLFPDAKLPKFTQESGPKTKTCDSSLTRKLLKWTPKYKSFKYYMRTVIGGLPEEDATTTSTRSPLWVPGDGEENITFQL